MEKKLKETIQALEESLGLEQRENLDDMLVEELEVYRELLEKQLKEKLD